MVIKQILRQTMLDEQEEDPLNHPKGNINIQDFITAHVKNGKFISRLNDTGA